MTELWGIKLYHKLKCDSSSLKENTHVGLRIIYK